MVHQLLPEQRDRLLVLRQPVDQRHRLAVLVVNGLLEDGHLALLLVEIEVELRPQLCAVIQVVVQHLLARLAVTKRLFHAHGNVIGRGNLLPEPRQALLRLVDPVQHVLFLHVERLRGGDDVRVRGGRQKGRAGGREGKEAPSD